MRSYGGISAFSEQSGSRFWFGLGGVKLARVPGDKKTKRYYRQLLRLSTGFALTADFALLTLGGQLKRKERISGRFADVLSHLYLCSCALKHFENQGSQRTTCRCCIGLVNTACTAPSNPCCRVQAAAIPHTSRSVASRAVSVGKPVRRRKTGCWAIGAIAFER